MKLPRRAAPVLVAMVIGATLGACGGGGSTRASPRKAVVRAASQTLSARTARVDYRLDVPGQPSRISGHGMVDFKANRASVTLSVPPGPGRPSGPTTTLITNNTVYLNVTDQVRDVPDAKPWIRIDPRAPADQSAGLGGLQGLSQPSLVVVFLTGATGGVRRLGKEDVNGVPTTHYQVPVDIARAQVPAAYRDAYDSLVKALGTTTLTIDVWVGPKGRIAKLQFGVDASKLTPPGTGTATYTLDSTDYSPNPLNVTAPPPDETATPAQLTAEETKTADQIYQDALAAFRSARSYHSRVQTGEGSTDDLVIDRPTNTGRVTITGPFGETIEVIVAGGVEYARGTETGNQWVVVSRDPRCGAIDKVIDAAQGPVGHLTKGPIQSVNGQRAIEIDDDGAAPGARPGRYFVALDGPPYPLRAIYTGPKTPGGPPDPCLAPGEVEAETGTQDIDYNTPVGPPITAPPNASG